MKSSTCLCLLIRFCSGVARVASYVSLKMFEVQLVCLVQLPFLSILCCGWVVGKSTDQNHLHQTKHGVVPQTCHTCTHPKSEARSAHSEPSDDGRIQRAFGAWGGNSGRMMKHERHRNL